ncbi:MAG: hypothetical protein IH623_11595 [Verrucomicrobia bacterium]|nr:hypothetical protein [Verrucomicrobiota bacterium]
MKLNNSYRLSLLVSTVSVLTLWCLGPACRVKSGQGAPSGAYCLDLAKYQTAQLTDSLNSPAYVKDNNLATFPTGRQVFLKTPFQVSGVLQLSGKKLQEWGRNEFPEKISNIQVGRVCSDLHLLHGAGGVYDQDGTTIAKLILHYSDNSTKEIEIKNGVHVRDWWGEPNQPITGTNSALVWTGSNPAVKKYGGEKPGSLRIYKTTLKNSQPGLSLTSIDYTSTMQNSSPFLLGLTVE